MSEFPLDPLQSKTLLGAENFKCTEDIVIILSMLDVENSIFYRPKDKKEIVDNIRRG